ncbi:MAG: replication-associated recombination protein A, partial [Longicatena sp.]
SILHTTSYSVPDYLRLTPVQMREEDKYDYGRSDLWNKIQYLPDKLSSSKFYLPETTSSYEKVLAQNIEKLRATKRSKHLATLKKQNPIK